LSWVLEEVPRRWGGTIPSVARTVSAAAAGPVHSWRAWGFQVRISVGNPRGQWCPVATVVGKPFNLQISTWESPTYRFGVLEPLSRHHAFLPNVEEDDMGKAPCGAPHPLGC
jgi:hypothetical protein